MTSSPRTVATTLLQPQERIDSLSNDLIIMQPDGHGYRYSTDDMLVAWFALRLLKNRTLDRFIDLGSGLGSVPMILLACLPPLQGVGIEVLAEKVSLFKRSLKANRLKTRFIISQGDLRDFSPSEPYKTVPLISTSPPYFPKDAGVVPTDRMRAVSMFELHGDIGDYIAFAARHLEENGLFVTVYPTQYLHKITEYAILHQLEIIAKTTVIPAEGKKSAISLIALSKPNAKALFSSTPQTLIIRSQTGQYTAEYLQARKICHFS